MRWHSPGLSKWIEPAGDRSVAQTASVPPSGCPSHSGCHSFSCAIKLRSEGLVLLDCWWAQHRIHPEISIVNPARPIPAGRVCRPHHWRLHKVAGATSAGNKNRSTVFGSGAHGQSDINALVRHRAAARSVERIHPCAPIEPLLDGLNGPNTAGDD